MTDLVSINSIARPKSVNEPDLLIGNEQESLIGKSLEGSVVLFLSAPECGWTHDSLEDAKIQSSLYQNGCDFYLGETWIGSSEL